MSNETKPRKQFYQRLLRWIHRCPQCRENSLLLGAKQGTIHICRSCRHRFTISQQTQVWDIKQEQAMDNDPADRWPIAA